MSLILWELSKYKKILQIVSNTIAGAEAEYATSLGNNNALKQVDIFHYDFFCSCFVLQVSPVCLMWKVGILLYSAPTTAPCDVGYLVTLLPFVPYWRNGIIYVLWLIECGYIKQKRTFYLGEPCTTNFLEAGHRMLDSVILCNHPREFYKLSQVWIKKIIIQELKS